MDDKTMTCASLLTETPDEAELLDLWLDERDAEAAVEQVELPPEIASATQDDRLLAAAAGDYDGDLAPGQIRILSKRFTLEPDVVPYVAVLEKWEDDLWLIAPFSPYGTPATPQEMATGIALCGLGVIQAWNGRTVHARLLEKSFLFGMLADRVVEEAKALFRNALAGTELPEGFTALRGPAIHVDADPRCDYVSESVRRLAPLSTAVKATERVLAEIELWRSEEVRKEMPAWQPGARALRREAALAAGDESVQTDRFRLGGSELLRQYFEKDGEVVLGVYDAEGEPDLSFDGYGVLIGPEAVGDRVQHGTEFVGVFQDGVLRLPASCGVLEDFAVVDRAGEDVGIEEIR